MTITTKKTSNRVNKKTIIIFSILILFLLAISFSPLYARTVKMLKEVSTDVFNVVGSLVVEKDATIKGNLEVSGAMKVFGEWESKDYNTIYQALTDGFVIVLFQATGGNGSSVMGRTDDKNPPTTVKGWSSGDYERTGVNYNSFTMPVRKGDHWKIDSAINCNVSIYWLPLGR